MKKVTTYDVYGKSHDVDVDNLEISVHVYGIAMDDEGNVLISPQWDGFDFPGGTAEKGETHVDTLKREFREESGYDVEPTELIGFETSFFHHRNKDYQSYLVFYRVKIVGGELSDAGFNEEERQYAKMARWVTLDELKSMHHACSVNVIDGLLKKLV